MTEQIKKEQNAKQRAEQIRKQREKRGAWDGLSSRFPQLPPREGYKTHWFNDKNGRVERALERGWEFSKRAGFTDNKVDLDSNPNQRIAVNVGTKEDNSVMYAYAMDIPEEIYEEDRAVVQERVDRKEKYIKEGKTETGASHSATKVEATIESNFKPD